MAKSKQRKGHKKRVAERNSKMKAQINVMQKILNETIKSKMEQLKTQSSGFTEMMEVASSIRESAMTLMQSATTENEIS